MKWYKPTDKEALDELEFDPTVLDFLSKPLVIRFTFSDKLYYDCRYNRMAGTWWRNGVQLNPNVIEAWAVDVYYYWR